MPHMLSSFKEQFPKTKIEVTEGTGSKILSKLNKDEIDIAFSEAKYKKTDIEQLIVEKQQLGFIVNKQHPLSNRKYLELKDLSAHTLVFHGKSEELGFQSDFLSLLNQSAIKVKIYYKKSHESCDN
jgi:DNA-binding transcriptional LysR family regulator